MVVIQPDGAETTVQCDLVNVRLCVSDTSMLALGPTQDVNHATPCPSEFPPYRLSVSCFLLGAYAGVVATVLEIFNKPTK